MCLGGREGGGEVRGSLLPQGWPFSRLCPHPLLSSSILLLEESMYLGDSFYLRELPGDCVLVLALSPSGLEHHTG